MDELNIRNRPGHEHLLLGLHGLYDVDLTAVNRGVGFVNTPYFNKLSDNGFNELERTTAFIHEMLDNGKLAEIEAHFKEARSCNELYYLIRDVERVCLNDLRIDVELYFDPDEYLLNLVDRFKIGSSVLDILIQAREDGGTSPMEMPENVRVFFNNLNELIQWIYDILNRLPDNKDSALDTLNQAMLPLLYPNLEAEEDEYNV